MITKIGPTLPVSEETHKTKYRDGDESFQDAMYRIANALGDNDDHRDALLDILLDMSFLPAGRVQAAIGSPKNVTPYNCYVSGTIEDSFIKGNGSIMHRAAEAAETMRLGGGIGYDFSTLRPHGDLIKTLNSQSSGPVSFMSIFDAICKTVASSGHRRGAQMGVLRVDHPDIMRFINAKRGTGGLTAFNISVGITDEFMAALLKESKYDLKFNGKIYGQLEAKEVWEAIMKSTWDWAEPGVLFLDTINDMNNLWYTEKIAATNPCGEQPLPPYGACLLGSFNLVKYLDIDTHTFNYSLFEQDIDVVVRAMDNIIDKAIYPLPDQEREAKTKRRMGLGVTGMANAIEAMGFPYGSAEFLEEESNILEVLTNQCYRASTQLAKEKGSFPLFDKEFYGKGKFIQTLAPDVQEGIQKYGIRNSHLTSIAPTGTISLCADNVSSGIEPVFAYSYDRTIQTFNGPKVETVEDYGVRDLGVKGRRAGEISVDEHLNVLLTAQKHIDSAVSKTLNVGDHVSFDEFKDIYMKAWKGGAKGCTTFREAGMLKGILASKDTPSETAERFAEDMSCVYDPTTGERSCE